ncbi:MAG: DNA methyltransferase, partial [Clostridia bacterium]|nr:DNA methyltransferase [Clostridia bacterium]
CHIKFRNQDLLDNFNLFASQRKGWLPPSYGKKAYNDMTSEEKELVKEFSGDEAAYNKIYNNQTAYLIDKNELLQITG